MPQTQRVSKNNTVVICTNGLTTVILHSTPVVTIDRNSKTVTFNNDGWITATTATRMNQACNEFGVPYCVGRKQGVMSARNHKTGQEFAFQGNTPTLPL